MALEEKKRQVEKLHAELARTPHAILVDFRGLDVAGATDLRRRLYDHDAKFRVVKNSIALRAIEELPLAELQEAFEGQTAIAYTGGDVVVLAKTLREFAREFETPTFKAGVVDGEPITVEEFETLAQLPSREELVGKALYLMQYPISGLVTALNGVLRGFVVALDQIRDRKDSGELPAGEPEPRTDEEAAPAEVAEGEPEPEDAEAESAETEAEEAAAGEAEAGEAEGGEAEAGEAEAKEAETEEAEAGEAEGDEAEEAEAEETPAVEAAAAEEADERKEDEDDEPETAAEAAGVEETGDEEPDGEAAAAGAEGEKEEAADDSDEESAAGEEEAKE